MPRARIRPRPAALGLFLALALGPVVARAQVVPDGFVVENVAPSVFWDTPVALAWLPDGRMLVAEKAGRLWVVQNGVRAAAPMWDGTGEVESSFDRGLLGIAVDPHWSTNRRVYLLYTVDPDSNGVDDDLHAFGRLTRYAVSADGARLDPASRTILLGTSWADGPLDASSSHSVGCLRFGRDGTLLASMGEGAHFEQMDIGGLDPGAFTAGRAPASDDVGAFRAQHVTSLGGKILRIDPETGLGLPSNPWYDGDPASVRSRVWAYGFRNPFRFSVRPGTGHANPAAGEPGMLVIGDVGWSAWEEFDVAPAGGLNFGWPCEEGILPAPLYSNLLGQEHAPCESLGTAANPATSMTPPIVSMSHTLPAQSTPPGLPGNCAIAGPFYTGALYPEQYRGKLMALDYGTGWLKAIELDTLGNFVAMTDFASALNGPMEMEVEPKTGDLVYISLNASQVLRIRYTVSTDGNLPPVADAQATPTVGVAPLAVAFSSTGSHDDNGDEVEYSWDFGDGSGSALSAPSHVYALPGAYNAVLTLDDGRGGVARDTIHISAASTARFPTTNLLDDFNRPAGKIGNNWSVADSGFGLKCGRLSLSGSPWGDAIWMATSFGPDQEAFFSVAAVNLTASEQDLVLKAQGTTWEDGEVEVRYDAAASTVAVNTYNPGGGWQTWLTLHDVLLHKGDQLGARAYGSGWVELYVNGVSIGAGDASGWPLHAGGGRIGLEMAGVSHSRLDNFGGGDAVLSTNTKPFVHVSRPDTTWATAGDTLRIASVAIDLEQPDSTLAYRWDIDIHHNNHIHPSVYTGTASTASYVVENHDDGTGVFFLVRLRVTDNGNLSSSDSALVFPEVDVTPRALDLSPGTPVDGQSTLAAFRLVNLGRMPAPRSRWRVRLDDQTVAEGDTLIAARDSVEITADLGLLPAGAHVLRVTADTLAAIVETDETNNALTVPLTVLHGVLAPGRTRPHVLALSSAWPNPAHGDARFTLELPRRGNVAMAVFDLQGRLVWQLPERSMAAGIWTLAWPAGSAGAGHAAAGVYLARVNAGGQQFLRRIVVLN